MPNREKLKLLYETVQKFEGDEVLLENVLQNGGNETLKTLEKISLDLLEEVKKEEPRGKSFDVRHTNPTKTVPTTSVERLEESVKASSPNALNTVMKAEHGLGGEHNSKFYDGIGFRVYDAHELQLRKKVRGNKTTTLYVDPVFDKTVGTSYEKKYSSTSKILYYGEYDIKDKEGNLGVRYSDSSCSLRTSVYLGENMGVNFSGSKRVDKYSTLKGSASVFEDGAAFKVEYEKSIPNKSYVSLGAYGSTEKKEIGVIGRLSF